MLILLAQPSIQRTICLLYKSDAADDQLGVDLGGRLTTKKKDSHIEQEQLRTVVTN